MLNDTSGYYYKSMVIAFVPENLTAMPKETASATHAWLLIVMFSTHLFQGFSAEHIDRTA